MKFFARTLMATAAMAIAGPALADSLKGSKDKPFFVEETPSQYREMPAPPPPPAPVYIQPAPPPPPAPAPTNYIAGDCWPADDMPPVDLISKGETEDGDASPRKEEHYRRGEMALDDGVLETIQEKPCVVIYRRGGETAESLREYTHPQDIRRVNVMENRRIPVHQVGYYQARDDGGWYYDPQDPFMDPPRQWRVVQGQMLSETLISWGEQSGYDVIFRSPHDFVIRADATITGSFAHAAGEVIKSFYDANPPITGEFVPGNRVLIVDAAAGFDGR